MDGYTYLDVLREQIERKAELLQRYDDKGIRWENLEFKVMGDFQDPPMGSKNLCFSFCNKQRKDTESF